LAGSNVSAELITFKKLRQSDRAAAYGPKLPRQRSAFVSAFGGKGAAPLLGPRVRF
jgi:hypothetical protein